MHFVELAFNALKPGGIFFASMMSEKYDLFYNNSSLVSDGDGWMRSVEFDTGRISVKNYYMHFVKDESDLVEKFALFDPLHIGEYGTRIRNDDGNGHHYTFCGVKKS